MVPYGGIFTADTLLESVREKLESRGTITSTALINSLKNYSNEVIMEAINKAPFAKVKSELIARVLNAGRADALRALGVSIPKGRTTVRRRKASRKSRLL